jgi:LacI family transcriptional regulator
MAEHILELGYRRLAYVAGPTDVSTAEDRLDGFRDALAAARMEPADVQRGGFTFESGYECATRILDGDGADVIVAANDLMAFGVLRAIEERGLSVPRDLGVAGFDHIPHIPYATFMHPELTTVEVPVHEMGREAARRLLDGGCDGVHVPTKLIRGGTCRQQERSHG